MNNYIKRHNDDMKENVLLYTNFTVCIDSASYYVPVSFAFLFIILLHTYVHTLILH